MSKESSRDVCATLGMFIMDVFEFSDDKTQVDDQLGGGGMYFSIAARMFLQPEQIVMIIDRYDGI